MKVIRRFKGHSNSSVFLVTLDGKNCVYKTMLKDAALCAAVADNLPFPTPKIFKIDDQSLLMEYIPGIDMKQYLTYATNNDIDQLISFLIEYIEFCLTSSSLYDFKKEIAEKYSLTKKFVDIDSHIDLMPKILPKGIVHGDLTLENILFYDNKFYFVDTHYTKLNSIYFDVNKLRQDLTGFWFIREEEDKMNYISSCNSIYESLRSRFPNLFDDHIYAFVLSRVLPYCKRDLERNLILSEIKKCKL